MYTELHLKLLLLINNFSLRAEDKIVNCVSVYYANLSLDTPSTTCIRSYMTYTKVSNMIIEYCHDFIDIAW